MQIIVLSVRILRQIKKEEVFGLANIKSAMKRIDIAKRNQLRNKIRKTEMKNAIKKFNLALNEDRLEDAKELLKFVDKKLKKASSKNVIHKNEASRKISRLTKKLNSKIAG